MAPSGDDWLGLLTHPDTFVRRDVAVALGSLGPGAQPAVPALIVALKDTVGHVRLAAAEALGEIGPNAKAAIPALQKTRQDRNNGVRYAAAQAVKNIVGVERKP